MSTTEMPKSAPMEANAPAKKSKGFVFVLLGLIIVGGGFGGYKYIHAQHHEETDDAQIESNISPVIPRIGGYVMEIRVKDNQKVAQGDTLVILDNKSELIHIEQMKAALANAENNLAVTMANAHASQSNIGSIQANIATIDAQIAAAQITLRRTTQDFERYSNLFKEHSITEQQYEQAEAAKQTAEQQLNILSGQKNTVQRQTATASAQSNAVSQQIAVAKAMIAQRKADVESAELNLSYTALLAAQDGTVSKVNAQLGQLLQPGQTIFNIVSAVPPWIVANFKETQMAKLRKGQKVVIHVDAFEGHDFEGRVSSISPATGAKFSLLPPDNASGNFVKTVQRMPVRIEFTTADQFLKDLRPGMNVAVDVHLD